MTLRVDRAISAVEGRNTKLVVQELIRIRLKTVLLATWSCRNLATSLVPALPSYLQHDLCRLLDFYLLIKT